MGCIDLRTAQKHLKKLEEAAKAVGLFLAESQAASIHLHESDYPLHPLSPLERLVNLIDRQKEGYLRAGNARLWPPALRSLLQAGLRKRREKSLTSYVSRSPP